MDVQKVLQEYQRNSHAVQKQLSAKPECRIFLMQNPDERPYILRIYDKYIRTYEAITGHSCPNLPQIYKTYSQDDLFVVEEEYIDGISLWEMISGGTRMDENRTIGIAEQICSGLDFLHRSGFVHRDIKPENVMLTAENQIFLIDLDASMGISRTKECDTTLLGTAAYAAPEQFGLTRSDERTDIYAMGILMNALLTGAHPVVDMYKTGSLGRVIEKCTRMNPDDRYPSAEELSKALALCRRTESLVSKQSLPPKAQRKRRKLVLILTAAAVVLGLGLSALANVFFSDKPAADIAGDNPAAGLTTDISGDNSEENLSGGNFSEEENGPALVEGTDYLQLYKEGQRDTLYLSPVGGTQSAPLFTEDDILIDASYHVYADAAVGRIVSWDEPYDGWMLSCEGCSVGATGYIHAEKYGKHYAILVKVTGRPMSAYEKLPDSDDIGEGYLEEKSEPGSMMQDIIPCKYEKGKPVTVYLAAMPQYDVLQPFCDNPYVTIRKYTGEVNWSGPVFEMTYQNPEGGDDGFVVKSQYNSLKFYFQER